VVSDLIDLIVERFNTGRATPVPSFIGEAHIYEEAEPPRLVWVPTSDRFGPPPKVGGAWAGVRLAGVSCIIWGPDLASTEQLEHELIKAVREIAVERFGGRESGWYAIQDAVWDSGGELVAKGIVCEVRIELQIPVLKRDKTTAKAETLAVQPAEGEP